MQNRLTCFFLHCISDFVVILIQQKTVDVEGLLWSTGNTLLFLNLFNILSTLSWPCSLPQKLLFKEFEDAKGVITIHKSRARLLTLPEYLRSTLGFCRVRVSQCWICCLLLCRSLFVLLFWPLHCLVLWFTSSSYFFGIFKLILIFQISLVYLNMIRLEQGGFNRTCLFE
jgi:hypothetical protein